MQEVFPIIEPFDKLLGKQVFFPDSRAFYRPLTYCITEQIPEGVLLFNTMTKSMVLLSDDEMESVHSGGNPLSTLVEKWFYAPADHDDKTLSQQVRNGARMLLPSGKGFNSYTIFTTTDCNARCFYCFEKGVKRIPMSSAVAEKAASFIAEHCDDKEVSLSWFGGEPLYNMEAIDIICGRLKERSVAFHSKMVSNGYLFDKELVRKAKENWKLRSVQITLDGTETVYNKVKAYIYEGTNAFRRVIGNIHFLLDVGIAVNIRLNIDTYNADNLMELSGLLSSEFSGKRGVRVYVHPLFGDSGHYAMDDSAKRKIIFEKMAQLQDTFEVAGLAMHSQLPLFIKTNSCMADHPMSLAIFPDGHFGKCEHYMENHFVGHLDRGVELDCEEVDAFKHTRPEIEACDSCPLYPDCYRLIRCDCNGNCYPELSANFLRQKRFGMRAAFYAQKKHTDTDATLNESTPC